MGLKLNARIDKKVQDANVRTEYATCEERIMLNGEQVEDVDEFVYLRAVEYNSRKVEATGKSGCKRLGGRCNSKTTKGMGDQRNREKNRQYTPAQDIAATTYIAVKRGRLQRQLQRLMRESLIPSNTNA